MNRVTTCRENPEVSGNLTDFRQADVGKLTRSRGIVGEKMLLTLCFELCWCLVASCVHICHIATCDVGNGILGLSATESRGMLWNFTFTVVAVVEL